MLALNNANRILNLELIATGSVTNVVVKPMEVLSIPLQKRAVGVMLVHNHPSGRLEPSDADKDLTDMLIQACKLMRTPVLDHVIITEHSYYSFQESGLLSRLEGSNKYVLPYDLERQYHEELEEAIRAVEQESRKKIRESLKRGRKEGERKGLQEGMRKVARQMLAKGLDIKLICDMTGLSIERVQQLKP